MIVCRNCSQLCDGQRTVHCPACGEPLHASEIELKTDVVLISNVMQTQERRLPITRTDTIPDVPVPDTAEELHFPPPVLDTPPPAPTTVAPRPRPPVPAREVHLVVLLGRAIVAEYRFHSGVISIGRDPVHDVVLDNPSVSRLHCKIRVDEDGERGLLEDMGAANGTFVNRRAAQSADLRPGDEIGVGKFTLLFRPSAQRLALMGLRAQSPRSAPIEGGETCFLSLSQVHRIQHDQQVQLGAHLQEEQGRGGDRGRRVPLRSDTTVLGRGADADIRLRGLLVARRHALIVRKGDRYQLIRTSGLRPVWVNGRPVRQCTLKHRDRIQVGGQTFRFFSAV